MATKRATIDAGVGFYESSTLGKIPLSFKGRELLANLRDRIQEAIDKARAAVRFDRDTVYAPISEARGNLAQYMSTLEHQLATKDRQMAEKDLEQARQREQTSAELTRVRNELATARTNAEYWQRQYNTAATNPFAVKLADATVGQLLARLATKLSEKGIS